MTIKRILEIAVATSMLGLTASPGHARLDRLEVVSRAPLFRGAPVGPAGAYERISMRGYFSVDPSLPANRAIADIEIAPRAASGRVHFQADLVVMQPVDPTLRTEDIPMVVEDAARMWDAIASRSAQSESAAESR